MNKKRKLIIKVFLIHLLIKWKLIPNRWYKSEIELARIKGQELYNLFNFGKMENSPAEYSKIVDKHFWDLW